MPEPNWDDLEREETEASARPKGPNHAFNVLTHVMIEVNRMQLETKRRVKAGLEPIEGMTGGPGQKGFMVCPKCGGELAWQYFGPRALKGRCATPGCLVFMA